jgi:hypothetical protein
MGEVAAQLPLLGTQAPRQEDALGGRDLAPEFQIVAVGIGRRLVPPDRHAGSSRCHRDNGPL